MESSKGRNGEEGINKAKKNSKVEVIKDFFKIN